MIESDLDFSSFFFGEEKFGLVALEGGQTTTANFIKVINRFWENFLKRKKNVNNR